jgi:hypothetical protein
MEAIMAREKEFVPQVITANRLRDGVIVYKTDTGWTETFEKASVFGDEDALQSMMAFAEADEAAQLVVAIYAFPVSVEHGRPEPVSMREIVRESKRPTVRLFNKTLEELES